MPEQAQSKIYAIELNGLQVLIIGALFVLFIFRKDLKQYAIVMALLISIYIFSEYSHKINSIF